MSTQLHKSCDIDMDRGILISNISVNIETLLWLLRENNRVLVPKKWVEDCVLIETLIVMNLFPSGGIDCSRSCPIWGIDSLCDHVLVEALIYQDHVLVETCTVHKIVS